jgi:hypothetical protein
MSIAHELSSDVAAAVLTAGEGEAPGDASERAELVLEVHSTLRRLSAAYRRRDRNAKSERPDPLYSEGAASGRR